MTIKTTSVFAAMIGAACLMTSCLGDGTTEQTFTYNYTDCFNIVTDLQSNQSEIRVAPTYHLEMEMHNGTATLTMNNISLPGVNGGLSFKFEGLKFSFDKSGNYVINATNVLPKGSGENYKFNNISIKFLDRVLDNSVRIPVYYIEYTINSRWSINAMGTNTAYFGTTLVNGEGAQPFETIGTYYYLRLDPQSQKANIVFNSAKFSAQMPVSLNFTLRDLPFTVTRNGVNIAKTEPTTPYINNETPNSNYDISDLRVSVNNYTGGTMTFTCNPPKMGKFTVDASLNWMTPTAKPSEQ